jgi:hypothetical protein
MNRYSTLPNKLRDELRRIVPSHDAELSYYPCRVTLSSGRTMDTVYIIPDAPYFKKWGVYPEHDPQKLWICIDDVVHVEESSARLPANFADQVYKQGETGWVPRFLQSYFSTVRGRLAFQAAL